jgi:hypothetical protein
MSGIADTERTIARRYSENESATADRFDGITLGSGPSRSSSPTRTSPSGAQSTRSAPPWQEWPQQQLPAGTTVHHATKFEHGQSINTNGIRPANDPTDQNADTGSA